MSTARPSLLAAALAAALVLAAPPARAGGPDVVFDKVLARITLEASGTVRVEEVLDLRFPSGAPEHVHRAIERARRDAGGDRVVRRIEALHVRDAAGAEVPFVREDGDDIVRVRLAPPAGAETWRITVSYTLLNAFEVQDDDAVVHLQLAGPPQPVRIEEVEAYITTWPELDPRQIWFGASIGRPGERGREYETEREESRIRMQTVRALLPYERFEGSVRVPREALSGPGRWTRLRWALEDHRLALVPPALLLLLFLGFLLLGRDAEPRSPLPQGERPELPPGEAGLLIDDHVDGRDLVATIIELARRGWLRFEKRGPSFELRLLRPLEDDAERLSPTERVLLEGIALEGAPRGEACLPVDRPVALDHLQGALAEVVRRAETLLEEDLVAQGLYRSRPTRDRRAGTILLVGYALILAAVGLVGGVSWDLYGPTGLVCLALAWPMARNMPRRTRAGDRVYAQLVSLRAHIEQAPHDVGLDPKGFEPLLPYAIAFGLTGPWLRAHLDRLDPLPGWLSGPVSAQGFAAELPQLERLLVEGVFALPRGG